MTRQDITAHFRGVVLVDQKCRLQIPIYNAHWMVSNIKSIKIPSKFQKKPIKSSVRSYFFIPTYFLTRTMTYTPRQMAPSRRSTPAWTELAVKVQESCQRALQVAAVPPSPGMVSMWPGAGWRRSS